MRNILCTKCWSRRCTCCCSTKQILLLYVEAAFDAYERYILDAEKCVFHLNGLLNANATCMYNCIRCSGSTNTNHLVRAFKILIISKKKKNKMEWNVFNSNATRTKLPISVTVRCCNSNQIKQKCKKERHNHFAVWNTAKPVRIFQHLIQRADVLFSVLFCFSPVFLRLIVYPTRGKKSLCALDGFGSVMFMYTFHSFQVVFIEFIFLHRTTSLISRNSKFP